MGENGGGLFFKKVLLVLLLFAVPLASRLLYLFYGPGAITVLVPDEYLYPDVGRKYIQGIVIGNLSVFLENIEHPVLSKLITGVLCITLSHYGLSDLQIVRLQSIVIGSLTCIVVYFFGKFINPKIGLFAWLILSFDPSSLVNGMASLDVTYIFFVVISIYLLYIFLKSGRRTDLVLSGIAFGLALSSKYTAVLFFPAIVLLFLFNKQSRRKILKDLIVFVIPAVLVSVIMSPIFWSPALLSKMFERQEELEHFSVFGKFTPTIDAILRGAPIIGVVSYFTMDLFMFFTYSSTVMLNNPFFLLLTISLLYFAVRRISMTDEFFQMLFPIMSPFFFFLFYRKFISFYVVMFSPFLALALSLLIVDMLLTMRGVGGEKGFKSRELGLFMLPFKIFYLFMPVSLVFASQGLVANIFSNLVGVEIESWTRTIFGMPLQEMLPLQVFLYLLQFGVAILLIRRLPTSVKESS